MGVAVCLFIINRQPVSSLDWRLECMLLLLLLLPPGDDKLIISVLPLPGPLAGSDDDTELLTVLESTQLQAFSCCRF